MIDGCRTTASAHRRGQARAAAPANGWTSLVSSSSLPAHCRPTRPLAAVPTVGRMYEECQPAFTNGCSRTWPTLREQLLPAPREQPLPAPRKQPLPTTPRATFRKLVRTRPVRYWYVPVLRRGTGPPVYELGQARTPPRQVPRPAASPDQRLTGSLIRGGADPPEPGRTRPLDRPSRHPATAETRCLAGFRRAPAHPTARDLVFAGSPSVDDGPPVRIVLAGARPQLLALDRQKQKRTRRRRQEWWFE